MVLVVHPWPAEKIVISIASIQVYFHNLIFAYWWVSDIAHIGAINKVYAIIHSAPNPAVKETPD